MNEESKNVEGKVRLGFLGGSQLTGNKGIKNPNTERKFGARHLTPPTIHILVHIDFLTKLYFPRQHVIVKS